MTPYRFPMRSCAECGKGFPDTLDYWLEGEASCRGCVVRNFLRARGHELVVTPKVGPDGRVIHGIDGTETELRPPFRYLGSKQRMVPVLKRLLAGQGGFLYGTVFWQRRGAVVAPSGKV